MLTPMVFAKRLETMVVFYCRAFDLAIDAGASAPGYSVLLGPAIRLAIHEIPADVAADVEIDDPPVPRTSGAMKLVFEVDDVASHLERLAATGAEIFETTTDTAFDAADPEGNILRVQSR